MNSVVNFPPRVAPGAGAMASWGMAENQKTEAEARTDEAFANGDLEDPRARLRARLKYFREERPAAFTAALEYYDQVLVPRIAGGSDPIGEWVEYGRRLGDLTSRGQTFAIDASGRAHPFRAPVSAGNLVLHVPDDTAVEALAIAIPRQLSAAQRATYDLLIGRARAL